MSYHEVKMKWNVGGGVVIVCNNIARYWYAGVRHPKTLNIGILLLHNTCYIKHPK